jgi:crotonobetainyl-CoA:carnitine CoA-transferase CaiB-like acyl-CoA transferase
MERSDLVTDGRFETLAARKANEDALDAEVSRWTSRKDAEAAMYLLQEAGVAAGVVRSHRELVEQDPQMLYRGQYVRVDHPEAGLRVADAPPVLLSRTPGILERAAPLLGEDNERILRELLGMSEEELAAGYVGGWVN